MENQETLDEKKKNKVLMGVIAALLIALGVTLYFLYSGNKDNVDLTAEKSQLETTFNSLSDTLDMRSAEIAQITDKNTELDSTVDASRLMIEEEKKKISALLSKVKMTKEELERAKQMIVSYRGSLLELEQRTVELTMQNRALIQENQKLGEDLNTEKKASAALSEQNKGLSKTVEIGSLLQLVGLEVVGVKQRPNGRDRAVKNAKAAESIKISFETGTNKVLPAGTVSLYVRVINPKGETISVANQGSGSMPLAESNTQVQYSTKADIDWNQINKKVLIYWKQFISGSGTYKVEIYQSGYLIGTGQVTLN